MIVDQEVVVVVAVAQGDYDVPGSVRLPDHGRGLGLPIVEIPDESDPLGLGSEAEEVDRLGHVLGRVAISVLKDQSRFSVHDRQQRSNTKSHADPACCELGAVRAVTKHK